MQHCLIAQPLKPHLELRWQEWKLPCLQEITIKTSSSNVINCLHKWPFMIVSCIQALMVCHRAALHSHHSPSSSLLRQLSVEGTGWWYPCVHVVHTGWDFQQRAEVTHRHWRGQVHASISYSCLDPCQLGDGLQRARQNVPCWAACTTDLVATHQSGTKAVTREGICRRKAASRTHPFLPWKLLNGASWSVQRSHLLHTTKYHPSSGWLPSSCPAGCSTHPYEASASTQPCVPLSSAKAKSGFWRQFTQQEIAQWPNPTCLLQMN